MLYGPCTICGYPATIKRGNVRLCNNHRDSDVEVIKPAESGEIVTKPAQRGRRPRNGN